MQSPGVCDPQLCNLGNKETKAEYLKELLYVKVCALKKKKTLIKSVVFLSILIF